MDSQKPLNTERIRHSFGLKGSISTQLMMHVDYNPSTSINMNGPVFIAPEDQDPDAEYKIVSPFGVRNGFGSFETFFDPEIYSNVEHAHAAQQCIAVNFVVDKEGTMFFEFVHPKSPSLNQYKRLNYQNFVAGVDVLDDHIAETTALEMLREI